MARAVCPSGPMPSPPPTASTVNLSLGQPSFSRNSALSPLGTQYLRATGCPTTLTTFGGMPKWMAFWRANSVGTRITSERLSNHSAWVVTMSVTTVMKGGRYLPRAFNIQETASGWTVTTRSLGCWLMMLRAVRAATGHMVAVMARACGRPSVTLKLAPQTCGAMTM